MAEDALHSKFSASSSSRFLACPGSMVLSQGKPNTSSKHADEGTAAHELASWCLADWSPEKQADGSWPLAVSSFHGRVVTAGEREFEVDDDMVRDVQQYVDNIAEYAVGADTVMVEVKVNYSSFIGCAKDDGWGTSDVVILKGKEIQVHDLKFGKGEAVGADNNPQCQLYALGALAAFQDFVDYELARMVIHQVRLNPKPIEWDCTVAELREFAEVGKNGVSAVKLAEKNHKTMPIAAWEKTFLKPGLKQCRWCKAKGTCKAARDEVTTTTVSEEAATPDDFAAFDFPAATENARASDDAWLSVAMGKIDYVEAWCKAVREEMASRLNAGITFDEWKLVQGKKGNRSWADEKQAEELFKTFRMKADQMYTQKLISPTVADNLLKKSNPKRWAKVVPLISQADGGIHVAHVSDKREAIKVTPTADDFPDLDAADSFDDLA